MIGFLSRTNSLKNLYHIRLIAEVWELFTGSWPSLTRCAPIGCCRPLTTFKTLTGAMSCSVGLHHEDCVVGL